eukprot:g13452.t1
MDRAHGFRKLLPWRKLRKKLPRRPQRRQPKKLQSYRRKPRQQPAVGLKEWLLQVPGDAGDAGDASRDLRFEEGPLGFELEGARVVAIEAEGQADRLGLRIGDRLLAVDDDVIPAPPPEDSPAEADLRVKRLIRSPCYNRDTRNV